MGILEFLFPKRCFGCREIGAYICAGCLNKLPIVSLHICPMCGKGSLFGATHIGCATKTGIDGLIAAFMYTGVAKSIVTKFKYQFVDEVVGDMTELIASFAPLHLANDSTDVVLGVPLHPRRFRWRGFNQADELGKRIARYLNKPFEAQILQRVRYTSPQMKLSGSKRRENMAGAFEVIDTKRVRGKRFLVIDDVWTTGSTLKECAKVLKEAGAKRVVGLVFARA